MAAFCCCSVKMLYFIINLVLRRLLIPIFASSYVPSLGKCQLELKIPKKQGDIMSKNNSNASVKLFYLNGVPPSIGANGN